MHELRSARNGNDVLSNLSGSEEKKANLSGSEEKKDGEDEWTPFNAGPQNADVSCLL